MTIREQVDTSLTKSNVLAERIAKAEATQQSLCDELMALAAAMDAVDEDWTGKRVLVDRSLNANNIVAEHLARAASNQQVICDSLMELAAKLDEKKVTLCPIEPSGLDQTAELLAWYDSVQGGPVSFGADLGRVYVVNSIFDVADRDVDISNFSLKVTEDASGADVGHDGKSKRRHIRFTNCNVTLDNITVVGQNQFDADGNPIDDDQQAVWDATKPFEHGLCFESCPNVHVTNYSVDGVFGDGAYIRDTANSTVLDGFRVANNGRQGVAVISGAGSVKILNGEITHSRRSGIDLEPNVDREHIADVEIGHMKIQSRLLPITRGGQGTLGNLYIHDVDLGTSGVPRLNIEGDHNENVIIERVSQSHQAGSPAAIVNVRNTESITLRDLTLPARDGRDMTAVRLSNVGSLSMLRCVFKNATRLVDDRTGGATVEALDCTPPYDG